MKPIVPYLMFDGNAKEAMGFYAKALGGETVFSQTYAHAPADMPVDPGLRDKIMHATLRAGDLTMMFSDRHQKGGPTQTGQIISLSLDFPEPDGMAKVFDALAEGGHVTMPLQDTFWGARFGMLADKFGVHWMFNHDKGGNGHT